MTEPLNNTERKAAKRTMAIVLIVLWIAFLTGILGYHPYHKGRPPQHIEHKVNELEKNDAKQTQRGE
ncbi:hypothetical protein 031MP004_3 [Bacillus phage 031MP004]|nr:hypothetical protein 022DV001_3 [Bacillus phage 022DV001]QFG05403.1 hypothetical protein 031MP003_3 [Bacillus phage 031MP003]QFG05494.1 hypothetical protein 031MP002_3 [Bacillus phage 031MP002]QFG05581.1 hypothetical protein 031MP004_3 [Bacillus phage 031MP004]QFG05756.1 hypothetical protein 055SW001_3 [Bacillus phage 055SW001]